MDRRFHDHPAVTLGAAIADYFGCDRECRRSRPRLGSCDMKPRQYRYVGPDEIRKRVTAEPHRTPVKSPGDLRAWLAAAEPNPRRRDYVPATFIVDLARQLWIADRRSEHVACAAGEDVLSAGELVFCQSGSVIEIIEATNQSTGFCPEPESWDVVATVLEETGIPHPNGFTTAFQFRRCDACGSTNLIKDEVFECSVCGAQLSRVWNYANEE